MPQRFEYKFVRLGEGWLGIRKTAVETYQPLVHQHAAAGWRLVQIFAPGNGFHGHPTYYEMIFERPLSTGNAQSGSHA